MNTFNQLKQAPTMIGGNHFHSSAGSPPAEDKASVTANTLGTSLDSMSSYH